MPDCAMCGEIVIGGGYHGYCNEYCYKQWQNIKHRRLYASHLEILIERGDKGIFLDSSTIHALHYVGWVTRTDTDRYKLSAHGYRAIELMYGNELQEAS